MKTGKIFRICFIAVAVLSLCIVFSSFASAENQDLHVKVMTRNMDAGTDFNLITTATDFEAAVMQTIDEVLQSRIEERAARLAAEIAKAKPDIIALQEVTTWEIPIVSQNLDQLDLLMKALRSCGQHYKLAAIQTLTQIEIPEVISFTDHNVILVKSGELNVLGSESHIYEQKMYFQLPDETVIPFLGGWLTLDLKLHDSRFKFVTTHLESAVLGLPDTFDWQLNQAKELMANLNNSNFPIILAGDFNSDAEHTNNYPSDMTDSYDYIVDAGYNDPWKNLNHPRDSGFTWPLFGEDNMTYSFMPLERIDLIFSDKLRADSMERTGLVPDETGLYASDHAGVVAVYDLLNHQPPHHGTNQVYRNNPEYFKFHLTPNELKNFRLYGFHRH